MVHDARHFYQDTETGERHYAGSHNPVVVSQVKQALEQVMPGIKVHERRRPRGKHHTSVSYEVVDAAAIERLEPAAARMERFRKAHEYDIPPVISALADAIREVGNRLLPDAPEPAVNIGLHQHQFSPDDMSLRISAYHAEDPRFIRAIAKDEKVREVLRKVPAQQQGMAGIVYKQTASPHSR